MELGSSTGLLDTDTGSGAAAAGAVHVAVVDVGGLCDSGLSLRLGEIGRAESRLAAMKSQVLAEVGRRHSQLEAQRVAQNELQSSKREAKRDVESAAQLEQLPSTSEALASGEIPQGHARLIARASGEGDIDQAMLAKAAAEQPFDEFAQTVRRHQQALSDDDGQALLDRQRKRRTARIFESPETGMFVLSGQFDQITGARIATALTAKEGELWHSEDPADRRTPQQRMADALAALICEPGDGKTQGTNLLVIADYDVVKQELVNARLADGSPIPIGELRLLARDADILPSIFDAKTQNMWLGRQRRTASEAQRVALMARDQGCVCCKANPLWCRAHHIIWWSKNGPTDLDNLLLVCDDCHKKIHLHGWTVHQHPKTRKYYLEPPDPDGRGRPRRGPPEGEHQRRDRTANQPTGSYQAACQIQGGTTEAIKRHNQTTQPSHKATHTNGPTGTSTNRPGSDQATHNQNHSDTTAGDQPTRGQTNHATKRPDRHVNPLTRVEPTTQPNQAAQPNQATQPSTDEEPPARVGRSGGVKLWRGGGSGSDSD